MAIYKSDIVDINLETGNIHRSFLNHTIGHKDDDADRFGVRAFRDGVAQDLSGCSCQAIFMAPDGTNIALTSYGTVDGNVAYVTLPEACYNTEGQFCLAIKLVNSGDGVTSTVRIIDGVVSRTGATGAVAPTESVPDYQEILDAYDAMLAATAAANTAIAEDFDATKAYPAGKYVINDGALYRLTADHAANVTWANTSKVAAVFGNDLSDLKSAITIIAGGELLTNWNKKKRIATNVNPVVYGSPSSSTSYDCIVADCDAGDVFTLSGSTTNAGYTLWCWCQSDGTKVLAPSTSSTYNRVEIKAPTGAKKLIVNSLNAVEHFLVKGRVVETNIDSIYAGTNNVVNLFSYIKKTNVFTRCSL